MGFPEEPAFHLGGAKVTPGCGDAGLKGGRWSPLPSKPCSGARGGAAHGSLSDHHALNQTPRSRLPHQARDHAVGDPHTPRHREATESTAQENGGATGCLSASTHRPFSSTFAATSLPSNEGPQPTLSQDNAWRPPVSLPVCDSPLGHMAPRGPVSPLASEGASTSAQLNCRRGKG